MRGLEGKIAFVTGAGRGVGRAIAERLADEGVRVAVTDLDRDTATATADAVGNGAVAVQVDVTDGASVGAGVEEVNSVLGPIDVLVNNAGWDRMARFLDTDEELWDRIIAINYKGMLHTCRTIVPQMVERGAGRVVNISSDAGRVGSMGESVYAGSKGAVIAFSKSLAREVARYQISVNVVCPGLTETALLNESRAAMPKVIDAITKSIPLRRTGQPEDVAAAVVFLASPSADYITGQTLSVSGGLTMV